MSKCVCDFSVRLQGPTEAMASVNVGESLTEDACRAAVGRWLAGSGAQNGQTGAWGTRMGGLSS